MYILGIDLLLFGAYLKVVIQLRLHARHTAFILIHGGAKSKELIVAITC